MFWDFLKQVLCVFLQLVVAFIDQTDCVSKTSPANKFPPRPGHIYITRRALNESISLVTGS